MEDSNNGFFKRISDIEPIYFGAKVQFKEDAMFDTLNEINAHYKCVEAIQRNELHNIAAQYLKHIEVVEKADIFQTIDNNNGYGIIIVGIGDISALHFKIIETAERFAVSCNRTVSETVEMIESFQDCMTIESRSFNSMAERICELVAEINEHKVLIDLSNRINHHPKHMQCQPINYRSPMLRPAIVRRGRRQSYKKLISGP